MKELTRGIGGRSVRLLSLFLLLCLLPMIVSAEGASIEATFTVGRKDTRPPGRVLDLAVKVSTAASLTLEWSAPGDDGYAGRATRYHVRYALSPIVDEAGWRAATPVGNPPTPGPVGTRESLVVLGLDPATTYYFVVKATDELWSWSAISNCASGTTLAQQGGQETTVYLALVYGQAKSSKVPPRWENIPPTSGRPVEGRSQDAPMAAASGEPEFTPETSPGPTVAARDSIVVTMTSVVRQLRLRLRAWWRSIS